MGICIRIQDQGFFRINQGGDVVRFPHVQGVIVIRIVCSDKIIFSVPLRHTRIRAMGRDRECIMVLVNSAFDGIGAGFVPVDPFRIPIHRL
ncbi:hypothetical protein D3C76_1631220 [compost metagenome]